MLKPVFCALLLTSSGICLAGEPPIPLPPETNVLEPSVDATAPPVPTIDPSQVRRATVPFGPTPTTAAPLTAVPTQDWRGSAGQVPYIQYYREAVAPPANDGWHVRYPYYSYRRPWYPPGPGGVNVTIIW